MNLIEQLGGYEKANKFKNGECEDGFDVQGLRDELLKYRRANNIFETGDKVIYPWVGNGICTYNSDCIVKTPCIHATDEEIKAGRRL